MKVGDYVVDLDFQEKSEYYPTKVVYLGKLKYADLPKALRYFDPESLVVKYERSGWDRVESIRVISRLEMMLRGCENA